jgi:arylsulfatase A-like enzyme
VLAGAGGLRRGFDAYDDRVDPPVCDTRLWALVNDAQVLAAKRIPALRFDGQPHWWQDFQRPAREVLGRAAEWIRGGGPEPWFAMVNLFDTHWPYEPSADATQRWVRPYAGPLTGRLFRADDWPAGRAADAGDVLHARDLYDGELWDLDRAVGDFLEELRAAGGDTAIVLTADHGEALGEAGEWSHEHPRVPQARVPLVVHAPGRVAAGTRVSAPVSGVDVAPTLLALAGVEPPPGFAAGGHSLLAPPPEGERLLFVQDHDNEFAAKDEDAVVRGRFKLLSTAKGRTLHDTLTDPMDEVDLSAQHPDVARELGAALDALQAAAPEPGSRVLDEDALRALGYVGH